MFFENILPTVLNATFAALTLMGVFLIARALFGLQALKVHKYSVVDEATHNDNPAVLIRLFGLLFATVIAFFGIFSPTYHVLNDLALMGQTTSMVICALFVSLWINDKFILGKFNNTYEILIRNVSVAIIEASTTIATALIFSGAFGNSEDRFVLELAWFGIGQAALIVLAYLYRIVALPDADSHIKSNNVAVALAMGGMLLSLGIMLSKAVSGSFSDWPTELLNVGGMLGVWVIFMSLSQVFLNYVIIPGACMRREIIADRNWGIGLVSGGLSIALTLVFNATIA